MKTGVAPLIQRRQHLPRTPSSAGLVRDIQGPEVRSTAAIDRRDKRKRCNLYAPRDVKTSIMCHKCSAYICKAHAATTTYCPTCAWEHTKCNHHWLTDCEHFNVFDIVGNNVIVVLSCVQDMTFCNMVKLSCPFFTNKIIPVCFDQYSQQMLFCDII